MAGVRPLPSGQSHLLLRAWAPPQRCTPESHRPLSCQWLTQSGQSAWGGGRGSAWAVVDPALHLPLGCSAASPLQPCLGRPSLPADARRPCPGVVRSLSRVGASHGHGASEESGTQEPQGALAPRPRTAGGPFREGGGRSCIFAPAGEGRGTSPRRCCRLILGRECGGARGPGRNEASRLLHELLGFCRALTSALSCFLLPV